MKIKASLYSILIVALSAFGEDCVLSDGWRFCRDDDGTLATAAISPDFDDSSWRTVEVPHDWAIEGPFDAKSKDGDTGKLPWRGVGVYRRPFVVSARDVAGTVALPESPAPVFAELECVTITPIRASILQRARLFPER